jgi:hypothetical protein
MGLVLQVILSRGGFNAVQGRHAVYPHDQLLRTYAPLPALGAIHAVNALRDAFRLMGDV